MIGELFYLTSPKPGVFVANVQPAGWDGPMQFGVSEDQLANFVGAYLALRKQSVKPRSRSITKEDAIERGAQQQRTA